MQTRSQTKKQKPSHNDEANIFIKLENEFTEKSCNYINENSTNEEIKSESKLEFVYDFDYASECWRSNKKNLVNYLIT